MEYPICKKHAGGPRVQGNSLKVLQCCISFYILVSRGCNHSSIILFLCDSMTYVVKMFKVSMQCQWDQLCAVVQGMSFNLL